MPRTKDDDWLPLDRALHAWGDPRLRIALADAKQAAHGVARIPILVFGDPHLEERQSDERRRLADVDKAQQALEREFRRQLRAGELVAIGLEVPLRSSSNRRQIAQDLWSILLPDFADRSATGEGLRLVDIRVRSSKPAPGAVQITEATPAVPVIKGKPSTSGEISGEMRRRARALSLTGNWRQDARSLHAWALESLSGRKIPTVDSIERRLRADYRQLLPDKKTGP